MRLGVVPERFKLPGKELMPMAVTVSSEAERRILFDRLVLITLNVYTAICLSRVNEGHAERRYIRQDAQLERGLIRRSGRQDAEQIDGRREPVLIKVRAVCTAASSDCFCPRRAVSVDDEHAYTGPSVVAGQGQAAGRAPCA
jgi:hypothetical protein